MRSRNRTYIYGLGAAIMGVFVLCLLSTYVSYQKERSYLLENAEEAFREAVQKDTDRRIKELGNEFAFIAPGTRAFEGDSITFESEDTIARFKNNKEVAKRMSQQEKHDFVIQTGLTMMCPIQVDLLDSTFQAALAERNISARTIVYYSLDFLEKRTEYSVSDTTLYHSYTPLKEVTFGPIRSIVLQAFVRISPLFILRRIWLPDAIWIAGIVALGIAGMMVWRRRSAAEASPERVLPDGVQCVAGDVFFDDRHGVVYDKEHRVELVGFRLRLFRILLANQGEFVETALLKATLWADSPASKDALTSTVRRLKEDLSPIVGVVVESARGRGYRLH